MIATMANPMGNNKITAEIVFSTFILVMESEEHNNPAVAPMTVSNRPIISKFKYRFFTEVALQLRKYPPGEFS